MGSRIQAVAVRPAYRLGDIRRYKNSLMTLLLALCVLAATVYLLRPPNAVNLGQGNVAGLGQMKADWAAGGVIVLVRHVERCDHSNAACLNAADGITERARSVAVGLGAQFEHLGLAHTDIYNSPVLRAVQTSSYMFNTTTANQDWLFNCKGTLLRDALAHKVAGRNLVLVTHSECMAELEKEMKVSNSDFGYGSALFLSTAKGNAKAQLLGYLDATGWPAVFNQ